MWSEIWDWIKRSWHFIWYDDSLVAWFLNVALAFVVIKFILYPGVGLAFGTDLPIVAVVSGSMEHKIVGTCVRTLQNGKCVEEVAQICGEVFDETSRLSLEEFWKICGPWYDERGITIEQFGEFPFKNGFNKGDIMLIRGSKPENLVVGDVLVFDTGRAYPIIHRIVSREQTEDGWVFGTKGDHNERQIVKYGITDGRFLYECYQKINDGIFPSLCGPGVSEVTSEIPGAIPVLDETATPEDKVIGKAYGRIPYLGYIKILFVDLLQLIGIAQPVEL